MFDNIISLIIDIFSRYRSKVLILVFLMSIVALSEGVGMAMLLPLLSSVGVSSEMQNSVIHDIVNQILVITGFGDSSYAIASMVLIIFFVQLTIFLIQTFWVSWLQRDYCAFWQRLLLRSMLSAKWSFISDQKLGELTNQIALETSRISGAFQIILQIVSMIITVIAYLIIAYLISWQITLLMVGFALFLFLVLSRLGKKSLIIGSNLGPLAAKLNAMLVEFLGSMRLIKATATENKVQLRVGETINELRIQHTWANFLPSLVKAIFEFSAITGFVVLLVFGYKSLQIPSASLFVILALFIRLFPRFNALQQSLHLLGLYIPAYSDAKTMLKAAQSSSEDQLKNQDFQPSDPKTIKGTLSIDICSGGYGSTKILHDIKLQFPSSGLVGIVGESGSGKSTLLDCILGMADIQDGDIVFGGESIHSTPLQYWRKNLGYVPQNNLLFHSSIRDNITWSVHELVTDEEVISASKRAHAHDFIQEQPNGYNEIIGDQGVRLSGGQRQRIGIARALISHPNLLIMDEATSALDSHSEAIISRTVDELSKETCVIMVAHRLTTVRKADLIVVMDKGRVVEVGTWNQLVDKEGYFFRLIKKQNLNE